MDFKGIGTIPYEIPPASLKSFFRRKYATVFRSYDKTGTGIIRKSDILMWTDRSGNYIKDLEARTKYVREVARILEEYTLFGRESITEKQFIDENMRVAFTDRKIREKYIKEWWKLMPFFFDQLDTNHDGFIDYEEVLGIYKIFGCSDEKSRAIFDTIDADGDGHITINEYGFAVLSYYFQSGPDSVLSLMFGPLAPEETNKQELVWICRF